MVPIFPTIRLLEEDPSFASYGEAYDVNCMRYGREADMPIVHFKKRCASPSGAINNNEPNALALRHQVCVGGGATGGREGREGMAVGVAWRGAAPWHGRALA